MYLKLEIDGIESLHPFEGMKTVTVGKSEQCDLIIDHPSISRIHAKVISKGGELYYVDMDSKEGSFLNEERLKPKAGNPFNTFFPIRLGTNVFLYLLDEEIPVEDEDESEVEEIEQVAKQEDATEPEKVKYKPNIYVPDSAGTITEDASKVLSHEALTDKEDRRKKRNSRRPIKKEKKADRTQQMLIGLLVLIVASFFYYKRYTKEQDEILQAKLKREKLLKKEQLEQRKIENKNKLTKEKLASNNIHNKEIEKIKYSILADKCLIDSEIALCEGFKKFKSRGLLEGYTKSLETVTLVIDVASSFRFLENMSSTYTEKEKEKVLELAKSEMGARFHAGFFINKMKYKVKKMSEITNKERYISFLDFFMSGGVEALKKSKGIETVILLGVDDLKYQSHIKLDVNKIKKLKAEDLSFTVKAFFNSSMTSSLEKTIKSLEIQ